MQCGFKDYFGTCQTKARIWEMFKCIFCHRATLPVDKCLECLLPISWTKWQRYAKFFTLIKIMDKIISNLAAWWPSSKMFDSRWPRTGSQHFVEIPSQEFQDTEDIHPMLCVEQIILNTNDVEFHASWSRRWKRCQLARCSNIKLQVSFKCWKPIGLKLSYY